MKKLIMAIGLCSVVLFGADMQVAQPMMTSVNFEPALNNATELKYVENKPAQITLNIPTNIENPEGLKAVLAGKEEEVNDKVYAHCHIYSTYQPVSFWIEKEVQTGSSTLNVTINGLPVDKVSYINKYICHLTFTLKSTGRRVNATFFDPLLDSSSIKEIIGRIEN